jgi:hypothetical protein
MSDTLASDQAGLAQDAQFADMLQRVSFQPGILLGASALSAEQAYHVRRLNRHQRWLVGAGTVFGMRVDVIPSPTDATDVLLKVGTGYGIDGLGREVLVAEVYAISLRDWLASETAQGAPLALAGGVLALRVTVRAQPCPNQLQPVMAELFDAGIDPVVPLYIGDSFLLEISADPAAAAADAPAAPLPAWSPDRAVPPAAPPAGSVTAREQAMLAATTDATLAKALNLQAWLLDRPLPAFDDSPGAASGYAEAARLLLASVHVSLASLTTPPTVAGTAVNNLVRPFVRPNILLAALALP